MSAAITGGARRRTAWDEHLASFHANNEDRGDGKPVADPCATPLIELAKSCPADEPHMAHARDVGARLDEAAFLIRRTSYEAWAAITQIETMFSDIRRIAPRFAFAQLRGEARIATGNEYRLAIADPASLDPLNSALADLDATLGGGTSAAGHNPVAVRRMDLRIAHAGPFGGETATMTWASLSNHRLAGLSSFWVVIHGDDDGLLRVTLEAAELFRWSWAPEGVTAPGQGTALGDDVHILDWRWYFERVAAALDG
jgi:hypothetical protein